MSKPGAEHLRLHKLAGEWTGEEMIYPAPLDRGGRASAHVVARVEMDGFFLVSDYVEQREGAPLYRGHGVYGWDASARAYTMHWFDSMGSNTGTAARGQWTLAERHGEGAQGAMAASGANGKADPTGAGELSFEHRTHQGYARYSYRFTEKVGSAIDVYFFRIESSRDGRAWVPFMEGKYRRVG